MSDGGAGVAGAESEGAAVISNSENRESPFSAFKLGGVLRLDEKLGGGMFTASPNGKVYYAINATLYDVTDDVLALMYCFLKKRPNVAIQLRDAPIMHIQSKIE